MKLFNKISKWIKMKFVLEDVMIEKSQDALEYKILILGERSVGKSSICTRFTMNEFNLEIKPTSQPECFTKTVKLGDEVIKIYLIDIDENVMSNDRTYLYADAKGVMVVYDVTKSKTFDKVENWILDFRQKYSINIPVIIIGNKCDLNFLKNVDSEEGLEKANGLSCDFYETSCVDQDSVKEAFKNLIAKIYYHDLPESKKNYFKLCLSNTGKSEEGNIFEKENKEKQTEESEIEEKNGVEEVVSTENDQNNQLEVEK